MSARRWGRGGHGDEIFCYNYNCSRLERTPYGASGALPGARRRRPEEDKKINFPLTILWTWLCKV